MPEGAVLVAVKHQSMYETLEIMLLLNEPAIVLKRELVRHPALGLGGAALRRHPGRPRGRRRGAARG